LQIILTVRTAATLRKDMVLSHESQAPIGRFVKKIEVRRNGVRLSHRCIPPPTPLTMNEMAINFHSRGMITMRLKKKDIASNLTGDASLVSFETL